MLNGDPWDRFFYPTLPLMIDSYNLLTVLKLFVFVAFFVTLFPKSTFWNKSFSDTIKVSNSLKSD